MSKFQYLKELNAPEDKIIPYTLYQIEDQPTLEMKQATDMNKPYWNGVLRRNSTAIRRMRGGRITAAVLDETRASDRDLFSKYVITNWKGVKDSDGTLVPFTKEDCLDFLKELPRWIFDEVRNFAADIQNFLDEDVPDEDATSGN